MAKSTKKRRARKPPKVRRSSATGIRESFMDDLREIHPSVKRESVEGPLEDDPGAGDAWLLEREGEDIQRGVR